MSKPTHSISLWGWISIFLSTYVLFYAFVPTSTYIDLKSVVVRESVASTNQRYRPLEIDRFIHRSFKADYQVTEYVSHGNGQWTKVASCKSRDPVNYSTSAKLPDPTEIWWWAYGDCGAVPVLKTKPHDWLRICTHYNVWLIPVDLEVFKKQSDPVCSNLYQGRMLPVPSED